MEMRPAAHASADKSADKPSAQKEAPPSEAVASGEFEGREQEINAPKLATEEKLSTFAIDVDTAAYSIARRTLQAGRLPTPSLVRVEELINYFHYDYDAPAGGRQPFAIEADGARSPVDSSKHLLRIGLQARTISDEERLPASLIFLVDTSCSMGSEDKIGLAKRSLEIAVDHLTAKDSVAISTYAGGVQLILPPTSALHKERIKRAIEGLEIGGGTAMESGLTLAYKQAAKMLRPNAITRIIVCSDGDANIGATTPEEMLKQVAGYVSEGVTISTIGYGDGNYKDEMMEKIADKGNGNYYYVDSLRQAERVFGRDLTKMIQDVAQDVKIQVEFNAHAVKSYRLVGYENRNVANEDFRNDKVDGGEIGAGHQVTALYELVLAESKAENLATVRVRAKEPRGLKAKEIELNVPRTVLTRAFSAAPADLRFAVAVMGGAELLRRSPYANGWSFSRVISILSDMESSGDPDRVEFLALMKKASSLSGKESSVSAR
jgi:Ca-activated chloride channel family protein